MIESDEDIYLPFTTAKLLIGNIQLITRVTAFDQRGILAVTKNEIAGSLESLSDDRPDRIDSLTRSTDDFGREAIYGRFLYPPQNIRQLPSPAQYNLLLTIGLVDNF